MIFKKEITKVRSIKNVIFIKNSTFFLILILVIKITSFNHETSDYEIKAVDYFYRSILKSDLSFNGVKIKESTLLNVPTRIYDLANSLGEINILKDSIPNTAYLDSIDNSNRIAQSLNSSIKIDLKHYKNVYPKGFKYDMFVYTKVVYNGIYYVEILLKSKKLGEEIIVSVKFADGEAVSYYTKSIVYD